MTDDFEALQPRSVPKELNQWNIADLEAYIQNLQAEIDKCKKVIADKKHLTSAADALFKS